jgi:alkylation response protein AidB-like acyl-CoA dehydrogenase
MDFNYSEEQQMLRDSVAKFVANDYDFDTRRKIIKGDNGFSRDNWKLFAELGWLMMPFKEADSGLGGSAVDIIAVMEELGKGIVIEPFLATAIMGGGIVAEAGNAQQKEEILAQVMSGDLQLALAYAEEQSRYNLADVNTKAKKSGGAYTINGKKIAVLNGNKAEKIIVVARTSGKQTDSDGISLFIVDANADGVTVQGYETVDGFQGADITFDTVSVSADNLLGQEGEGYAALDYVIDRATLAVCAEAVGAMEVSYKKTVEYTKTRKQFGVPIAKFQALQHRMADMFIEHEQAKSMMLIAAMKCDSAGGIDKKQISAAKSRIGKAARKVGQESVQIHGGIGVTDELDVGHYFKRLTTIQFIFGSTDWHTQRFAEL